ncbi:MAG TPA: DMT family transporter [Anaerolineales bacterium]|nr:DMT family transporter [Anaerolineales bacterium]HLF03540.1 DMT family transporter [Anaerolineales bacterium]
MFSPNLLPALLGLASAVSWGAGDFCGGLASKRASAYGVVITSQAVGAAILGALAILFGERLPPVNDLIWGALAGAMGAIGLLALYRGLASGRMGVVAPVSGVVGAAIPVLAGAIFQGLPAALKLVGFGAALAGVWFISRPAEAGAFRAADLGSGLTAGVGFGLFFVLIDQGNDSAVFWPLLAARAASLTLMGGMARFKGEPLVPARSLWPLTALAGALDAGGNAFFVLAARAGRLDVASVLSSLYPASTVLLAWLVLKERLNRWQTVGVLAALAAIVMITV